MTPLTSCRLSLRKLSKKDADFIVKLLNDPDWHKYIGDHGVKNYEDALAYIKNGSQTMYRQHNIGLLLVETIEQHTPIGLCGLLQRPKLLHPDLGFAFLPKYRKQGYALEAAKQVLSDAFERKISETVLAITSIDNEKSINLLLKLGFNYKKLIDLTGNKVQTKLFELSVGPDTLSALELEKQ